MLILQVNSYKTPKFLLNKKSEIFFKKKLLPFVFYLIIFLLPLFTNQLVLNHTVTNSFVGTVTPQNIIPNSGDIGLSNAKTRQLIYNSVDVNNNLIADGFEQKIASLSSNDIVNVIIGLKDNMPIPSSLISSFKSYGGAITFQWDSLGMFAGTMPVSSIKVFAKSNQAIHSAMGIIEEDRQLVKFAEPEKLTNVQPYVWNNYNLLGDKNNSIAILDTGMDDSHPMLANYSTSPVFNNDSVKIVGWFDATNDGASTPQDMDGHGSHVAAIAAGNPYNDTAGAGYIKTTLPSSYNTSDSQNFVTGLYSGFPEYINITHSGTVSMTYYWKTTGSSSGTKGVALYLVDPQSNIIPSATDSTNTPITANSGEFSINYNVTSNFGLYEILPAFNYQNANSALDMVTYGTYPFSPEIANATQSSFSGVAPETKLVGVKVFDNIGNGETSYLINGIDWVINHKDTYHITIASMSIGYGCSVNGCVPSDAVANIEVAVNKLVNSGIVTFVAAGNTGDTGTNQIGTPANLDSVITVGATDNSHSVTSYSSLGPGLNSNSTKPDLTAPGGLDNQGAILSADSNDNDAEGTMDGIITDFQANDLAAFSGTSMATPHAAGIGSLIIQAMGGYYNWNYTSDNVDKVKQIMLMSTWATYGADRGSKDVHEGWGEIQANAAIDVLKQPNYDITTALSGSLTSDRLGSKIWGRQVFLNASTGYIFAVNMSIGLDADLYIYNTSLDSYGDPVIVASSTNNGLGIPEYTSFTPKTSGNYYIYVKTWSGKGTFTVSSHTGASIVGPEDLSFVEGSTGKSLQWIITDNIPLENYSLYKNGGQIDYSQLSGTSKTVTYDLTGLAKGDYNFTIAVYDQDNNFVTDSVMVTVLAKVLTTSSQSSSSKVIETSGLSGFPFFFIVVLAIIPLLRRKIK